MTAPSSRIVRGSALVVLCALCMGNRPACDPDPTLTLNCHMNEHYFFEPGTCVEFQNPCEFDCVSSGHCPDLPWDGRDVFRLCNPPPGLYVRMQSNPRARFLCAHASVGGLSSVVDYYYFLPRDNTGIGTFIVNVGLPMTVSASANPTTISVGGTSQLTTSIADGFAPFSFYWSPQSPNDYDAHVQNPIVRPRTTTQYTVTVTDRSGAVASASATVFVGFGIQVTATPTTINPGGISFLMANAQGGTPPYTYEWTPAATLDDATISSPIASPATTTTYHLVVSDSVGASASGDVTVFVNLVVSAGATPYVINAGESSQLQSIARGGSLPYSFEWSPSDSLDDASLSYPMATPAVTTQYTVVVTDAVAVVATDSVTVTVLPAGLTACFTAVQTAFDPPTVEVDATCSAADIVEYRWWADYNFVGQPPTTSTTTPLASFLYEELGTMTLRLEVVDNLGATHATTQEFDVQ